jgi:hypothetical protein
VKLALLISCAALAYNPESCPTVTVEGEDGGPLIINKTDYDATPDAWELFDDSTAAAPAPAPAPATDPAAPAPVPPVEPAKPVQMVVSKIGKGADAKFYVTDMEKNKITGTAGIDEAGYGDEGSAWAAITAALAANG